jgi:hypothetical protein
MRELVTPAIATEADQNELELLVLEIVEGQLNRARLVYSREQDDCRDRATRQAVRDPLGRS